VAGVRRAVAVGCPSVARSQRNVFEAELSWPNEWLRSNLPVVGTRRVAVTQRQGRSAVGKNKIDRVRPFQRVPRRARIQKNDGSAKNRIEKSEGRQRRSSCRKGGNAGGKIGPEGLGKVLQGAASREIELVVFSRAAKRDPRERSPGGLARALPDTGPPRCWVQRTNFGDDTVG
jgi:hypothetical protein